MRITFSYKIGRNLQEVDSFRRTSVSELKKIPLEKNTVSEIELCIYEILVNVIDHSKPIKDKTEEINITIAASPDIIKITIKYYALKFDITKHKIENIKEHYKTGKNRGLGLYIISKLMDSVKYSFKNNLNSVTLTKKISAPPTYKVTKNLYKNQ